MTITGNFSIVLRSKDNAIVGFKNGEGYEILESDPNYEQWKTYYDSIRGYRNTRAQQTQEWVNQGKFKEILSDVFTEGATASTTNIAAESLNVLTQGLEQLMNFFSEFAFSPSFRFTNTLAYMVNISKEAARRYIVNYFALMDSSYKNEVKAKISSAEFSKILDAIRQFGTPSEKVNKRFKVYYGAAGTGKTTLAQSETENRCIVCNSSMLPSDLMEDFIFKDGNPDFNPSVLWNCMEEGKTIVLDEINLLPFDSLRFLQGILDGKTEFAYKNRTVHIHEGFQIVGTMNLSLGGMVYGLPEPLVDRCCDIREFTLTASQLAKAITGA